MIGFFLGTGILNLLVGYLLAVLMSDHAPTLTFKLPRIHLRLPRWLTLRPLLNRLLGMVALLLARLKRKKASAEHADTETSASTEGKEDGTTTTAAEVVAESPSPLQDFPKEWLANLSLDGVEPKSFVEASAHVLRLEVGRYREQLLNADGRARQCQATGDVAALEVLRGDITKINQQWLATQQQAAKQLGTQHGKMEAYEETGLALEETLLDQASQIESTDNNLNSLDLKHDPNSAAKRISIELGRLIDLAHVLRDRMYDTLAMVMRSERRLEGLSDSLQRDALTGMLNRIGFEKLLCEWYSSDVARLRIVSICVLDVDRFGRLNERLGHRAGDRLLAAIGKQLSEFVRKDRGFDRVIRLEGEQFLFFLGDTGPRQALAAIERIRQTVEAITLSCDGTDVEFTVSSGVCELDCNAPAAETIAKARLALKESQKAGRNRSAVDEGTGPEVISDPPRYTVKARVIDVPNLG